jgi:hypothetical protein
MGTTVPSAPSDKRMDDDTLPIPSGGKPMVTSVDREGSPAPNLFAHLMEDVANIREAPECAGNFPEIRGHQVGRIDLEDRSRISR